MGTRVLLFLSVLVTLLSLVDSAIITVDEDCSLRNAIDNLNDGSLVHTSCPLEDAEGVDTILITINCEIEVSGANEDDNHSGDFDITKSVNIFAVEEGIVIDGKGLDRVFDIIGSGIIVSFVNLTIQNGLDNGSGSEHFYAGAIRAEDAQINLQNVQFISNKVELPVPALISDTVIAAGAVLTGGSLSASGISLDSNEVSGVAEGVEEFYLSGGILFYGSEKEITIVEGEFTKNKITADYSLAGTVFATGGLGVLGENTQLIASINGSENVGVTGGMMYFSPVAGATAIRASGDWKENVALREGGVLAHYAESAVVINLQGFSILNNKAEFSGGAFYFEGEKEGPITISQFLEIKGNSALNGYGGVVFLEEDNSLELSGDPNEGAILENSAPNNGGGVVFASGSSVTIQDVRGISKNKALSGVVVYGADDSNVVIQNVLEILENEAELSGGVVYVFESSATMKNVTQISRNNATTDGGVVAAYSALGLAAERKVLLENIELISENIAGSGGSGRGGVVRGEGVYCSIVQVEEISENSAYQGGVISSELPTDADEDAVANHIQNVKRIVSNVARSDGAGGVQASSGGTTVLEHVEELLDGNECESGYGGVMSVLDGHGRIFNVTGNVTNNQAFYGGLLSVRSSAASPVAQPLGTLDTVLGNITENTGFFEGGLLHCGSETGDAIDTICTIVNVRGNVQGTSASDGGLIYSDGLAVLEEIRGDVLENVADHQGGVVHAKSGIEVSAVHGRFVANSAKTEGGCFYAEQGDVKVNGVRTFEGNHASSGGVAYVQSGDVLIDGVGLIEANEAKLESASVAYAADGRVVMENVCSIIGNLGTAEDVDWDDESVTDVAGLVWASEDVRIAASLFEGNTPEGRELFSQTGAVELVLQENHLKGRLNITGFVESDDPDVIAYIGVAEGYYEEDPEEDEDEDEDEDSSPSPSPSPSPSFTYEWYTSEFTEEIRTIKVSEPWVVIWDTQFCSVNISVKIPDPQANIGASQVACPDQRITLGGSPSGTAGPNDIDGPLSYHWEPSDLIDEFSSSSDANPQVVLTESTEFTLTVTDLATGVNSTAKVTHVFPVIEAHAGPTIRETCEGLSLVLGGGPTAQSNAPSHLTFTYEWFPATGLNSTTASNPTLSVGADSQEYRVRVSSTQCPDLQVESEPTLIDVGKHNPPDIDASPDPSVDEYWICKGSAITLGGYAAGYGSDIEYLWSPPDGLDGAAILHPQARPQKTTNYTLRVQSGCGVAYDSVMVNVIELQVDAGVDLLDRGRLGGAPTVLGGDGPYSYAWTPTAGLDSPISSNPLATPSQSTQYSVVVRDANNCVQSSSTVNVVVRKMSTAGAFVMRYSYDVQRESRSRLPATVEEATRDLMRVISETLGIPPLAVGVQTMRLFDVHGDGRWEYEAGVVLYEWDRRPGTSLVFQWKSVFACTLVVPCEGAVVTQDALETGLLWVYFPDVSLDADEERSFALDSIDPRPEPTPVNVPDDDDVPVLLPTPDFTIITFFSSEEDSSGSGMNSVPLILVLSSFFMMLEFFFH